MAQSNSYSNPQRIVDKQFEVLRKSRIQQQKQWMGTMQQMQSRNIQKKKAQQIRYQRSMEQKTRMENSVSGFSNTGFDTFDNNIKHFWDSKVDDYFEIKNRIATGEIDAVRGKAALNKINQQVLNYKQAVKPVLTLATAYNQASKIPVGDPGSVSSITDQDLQEILAGIAAGGNVNIVDRNGELFLYMPGDTDETGASVQISDLLKLESAGEALILQEDDSKFNNDLVDNTLKPKSTESAYITTSYKPTEGNSDNEDMFRSMDATQVLNLKADMYRQGAYSKRVANSNIMTPLWMDKYNDKDVIAKAYENNTDEIKIKKDPNCTQDCEFVSFKPEHFYDTDWQTPPTDLTTDQKTYFNQAQLIVARHVMINSSVDKRVKELGYENETYTGTNKKRKFQNETYANRAEEINSWVEFAKTPGGVDAEEFVSKLNHATRGRNFRTAKNADNEVIIMEGTKEYLVDLKNPKEVLYALANVHGVRESTAALALLP